VTACIFYLWLHPWLWPPAWLERRTQRQEVLRRVQAAGGWTALERDCDALADAYPGGFTWHRLEPTPLPQSIAALKPRRIDFYSQKFLRQFGAYGNQPFGSNVVVRILIFGAHSTGGHSEPPFGLDVLCEPGVTNYNPMRLRSESPPRYWRYRKVADDVYEFY
jgi:hypothetical protein